MIDTAIWHTLENAKEIPFYMRYDFDERCLGKYFDDNDVDGVKEEIYSWMHCAARNFVDEIEIGAPFYFVVPEDISAEWGLKWTSFIESPDGPIRYDFYVERYNWKIAASVAVRIGQHEQV